MSDMENKLDMDDLEQVSGGRITGDQAYATALKDAKVNKDQALFKKSKLDREHGRMIYEVEFVSNGLEYEYDIDANTGKILKRESEIWD